MAAEKDISRRSAHIYLSLLVISGFLIRIYKLNQSFWLDEFGTWHNSIAYSFTELFFQLPFDVPHAPLYFSIIWIWTQITPATEFWLRLPSVIFSVVSIPCIYLLVRTTYSQRVSLLTSSILTVSSFQVRYAQEARPYSLLLLLTIISTYYLILCLRNHRRKYMILYAFSVVLLIYTHTYAFFIILSQVGAIIVSERELNKIFRPWGLLFTSCGIISLPIVSIIVYQQFIADPGYGHFTEWITPPTFNQFFGWPLVHIGIFDNFAVNISILAIITIPLLFGTVHAIRNIDNTLNVVALLYIVFLIYVPMLVSVFNPIFVFRYSIPVATGFFPLLAIGVYKLENKHLRVIFILMILLPGIVTLPSAYENKRQWDALAEKIEEEGSPDDKIVVVGNKPWVEYPLRYYFGSDRDIQVIIIGENTTIRTSNTTWVVAWYDSPDNLENIETRFESNKSLCGYWNYGGPTLFRYC